MNGKGAVSRWRRRAREREEKFERELEQELKELEGEIINRKEVNENEFKEKN